MHFESKLYDHEIISLDVNDHKIAQLDVNVSSRWTYITLVYTLVTCIFADFAVLKVFFWSEPKIESYWLWEQSICTQTINVFNGK